MIGRRLGPKFGPPLACSLLLAIPLAGCASPKSSSSSQAKRPSPATHALPGTTLVRLDFITLTQGWAVTQTVAGTNALWHTSNGGRTWANVTPPGANPPGASLLAGTDQPIQGEAFVTGLEAWVPIMTAPSPLNSERDTIYLTVDAGDRWTAVSSVSGGGSQLTFLNSTDGFDFVSGGVAAGSSSMTLLATENAGRQWQMVVGASPAGPTAGGLYAGCDKTGVGWVSPTVGWLSASCSGGYPLYFYRTTNGGSVWAAQALSLPRGVPAQDSYDCMCGTTPPDFFGTSNGLELTSFYPPEVPVQIVYRTTNGGQQWQPTRVPTGFGEVEFPSFEVWVAVKGHQLAWTRDSGEKWLRVASGTNLQGAVIDFVNADVGWAVTSPGGPHPQLIHTADAGRVWSVRAFPQ